MSSYEREICIGICSRKAPLRIENTNALTRLLFLYSVLFKLRRLSIKNSNAKDLWSCSLSGGYSATKRFLLHYKLATRSCDTVLSLSFCFTKLSHVRIELVSPWRALLRKLVKQKIVSASIASFAERRSRVSRRRFRKTRFFLFHSALLSDTFIHYVLLRRRAKAPGITFHKIEVIVLIGNSIVSIVTAVSLIGS